MKSDVFKDVVARRNQTLWLVLAFQGGFMNAGGFLACHRFVSHITGYGTYVGVTLALKDYVTALEMAMAPLFFLGGAAYSGWLVDRRLMLGRAPKIEAGIVTLAAMNLIIYLGESSGFLGEFGEPLVLQRDFFLLFCLCFACGVQNGLFSGLTGGQVRTTHLTGPTTDIGINLSKILALEPGDAERRRLSALNWLRVKIAASFSIGSMIAALVFTQVEFEGFAIPCSISLFLVWYVRRLLRWGEEAGRRITVRAIATNGLAAAALAAVALGVHEPALFGLPPRHGDEGRTEAQLPPIPSKTPPKTYVPPKIQEAEAHLEQLRQEREALVREIESLKRTAEDL